MVPAGGPVVATKLQLAARIPQLFDMIGLRLPNCAHQITIFSVQNALETFWRPGSAVHGPAAWGSVSASPNPLAVMSWDLAYTLSVSVIELQKNKWGCPLYPSFPQQHGPHGVVKISEGPGILWLPCNSNTAHFRIRAAATASIGEKPGAADIWIRENFKCRIFKFSMQ